MMKTLLAAFLSLFLLNQAKAQTDTTAKIDTAMTVVADSASKAIDTVPVLSFDRQPAIPQAKTVYKLNPAVDIPLTLVDAGWTLYAFTKIYSKPLTDEETV